MGTGYIGGTNHHHSISENISALKEKYPIKNGYFGEKGQGRDFTRNISSKEPVKTAKDFFDKAAHGGISQSTDKAIIAKMKDGTIISYRETSTSDGTPVVEINIKYSKDSAGLRYQKIHFTKEEKQ